MSCIATISAINASIWLASTGDDRSLLIGTEDTFPPYILRDEAGGLSGFDYEVMSEICTRTRHDCQWEVAQFGELIPGVAEGRFDVVLGGMAITPERRAVVDMSIPYTWGNSEEWYIGRPEAPPPERARIAVESGTMHETWLRQQKLNYQAYISEPAVLNAVAGGDADLALGPFSGRTDLETLIGGQGLTYVYSQEIPDEGTGIAVCKGNALKSEIDTAIQAMEADGTLDRIHDAWF